MQLEIHGFFDIKDFETNAIVYSGKNAIHFENMSEAIAMMLANKGNGYIYEVELGNGGTSVDSTGIITYLPANNRGQDAQLYNKTYSKIVDNTNVLNNNPLLNRMEIRHATGMPYTDIFVTWVLDYGEPSGQDAFDNSSSMNGKYVFDELGLKSWDNNGNSRLLTHAVFHPFQKALNRKYKMEYTIRIQTLTNLSAIG